MSTTATPDPDVVAAALDRYLAARTRARHEAPGGADDLATAREGLVCLLRQTGWGAPASAGTARQQDRREDRRPRAAPSEPWTARREDEGTTSALTGVRRMPDSSASPP